MPFPCSENWKYRPSFPCQHDIEHVVQLHAWYFCKTQCFPNNLRTELHFPTSFRVWQNQELWGNFVCFSVHFDKIATTLIELPSFVIHRIVWYITFFFAAGGPSSAIQAAAVGAVLLALIEGVGIAITRMTAEQFKPGNVGRCGVIIVQ